MFIKVLREYRNRKPSNRDDLPIPAKPQQSLHLRALQWFTFCWSSPGWAIRPYSPRNQRFGVSLHLVGLIEFQNIPGRRTLGVPVPRSVSLQAMAALTSAVSCRVRADVECAQATLFAALSPLPTTA